jgi:glucokinase
MPVFPKLFERSFMHPYSSIAPVVFPVLIGDIGGTNARLAILPAPDSAPEGLRTVPTADFPTLEDAIRECVLAHSALVPRSAILDLAAPIDGEAIDLTNADWVVRPRDLVVSLGLEDVILLNDFEALALALPDLPPEALAPIGPAREGSGGTRIAVGPGTGLGVGGIVRAAGLWVPVPGEGGHIAIGPAEEDEFPVWAHIEPEEGRISAEALLSGRGIVRLYRAVARSEGAAPVLSRAEDITAAALAAADPPAVRALDLFCRLLGRVAGDIALIFMARGGVYIAGGIAPDILPILRGGGFRRAFEAKAPYEKLMPTIPTSVIVDEYPALRGIAALARAPQRFGLDLVGRRWRR